MLNGCIYFAFFIRVTKGQMMIHKSKFSDRFCKAGQNRQGGFSLVELMVVIAIVGIVSAIVLPSVFNPENNIRKAARELMGDMQQTRMQAIRTNQDWAIVFVPGTQQYLICSGPGPDNVWSATGDNPIEKTVHLPTSAPGVRFGGGVALVDATVGAGALPADGVSFGSNVLTFNPRGTCPSGFVYLFYRDASYAVGTLSTGLVRIRRWTGGAWQ